MECKVCPPERSVDFRTTTREVPWGGGIADLTYYGQIRVNCEPDVGCRKCYRKCVGESDGMLILAIGASRLILLANHHFLTEARTEANRSPATESPRSKAACIDRRNCMRGGMSRDRRGSLSLVATMSMEKKYLTWEKIPLEQNLLGLRINRILLVHYM
jgi:hypothetical protein